MQIESLHDLWPISSCFYLWRTVQAAAHSMSGVRRNPPRAARDRPLLDEETRQKILEIGDSEDEDDSYDGNDDSEEGEDSEDGEESSEDDDEEEDEEEEVKPPPQKRKKA
jgi:hypothetical protein